MWVLALIILAAIGIIILIAYFRIPKCPKCGKRKCSEISRIETGKQNISIQKEEKIKHYGKDQTNIFGYVTPDDRIKPESVTVRKYTVPGVRTFYEVTYSCVCGNKFSRREHDEREI